jgi:peptide/nickel transport system substrate-binding protein
MTRWFGRGRLRIVFLALVVSGFSTVAAISASGATGSHRSASKSLGTFIVRNPADWNSFDWAVDLGRATNIAYVSPGYDRLISFGSKGGADYVPYLATSWQYNSKSITFHLRRDAKCSDGHVLTPVDILQSVKRSIFVPKRSGSIAVNQIGGFGRGPYHLRASNAKGTFTLAVEKPWANLLGAFAQFPIVCPAGLAALKDDPHYLETHIVGSGPYTLVSAEHGNQVVWKIRPEWHWGPKGTAAKNMPDTLIMKVISDDTTAANLLLSGGLTMALINGPDSQRLASSPLYHTHVTNYQSLNLFLNQAPGKLLRDDEGVRQAIMTAIDPVKVNQTAYFGTGTVGNSVIRPGAPCYDAKAAALRPAPDVAKANKILDQDGWVLQGGKRIKNGQTLKLTIVTTPLLQSLPDYLQQVISSLGIEVDLQNLVGSAYGAAVLGGRFDISPSRSVVAQADPGAGQISITGPPQPQGFNVPWAGTQDAELQRLEAAAYQNPGKGGCKYWALVQQRIIKNAFVVPTVFSNVDLYAQKGIVVPPYTPEQAAYPYFFIHPKGS